MTVSAPGYAITAQPNHNSTPGRFEAIREAILDGVLTYTPKEGAKSRLQQFNSWTYPKETGNKSAHFFGPLFAGGYVWRVGGESGVG
jgi:hypothetical protein